MLHLSLRDLAPEILLGSTNIVDDVEHCLKADTSPHLAEQLTGDRDFLAGTLHDVMAGRVQVPDDRPVVFSPFGLGVLDLAVGQLVHAEVASAGELDVVPGFFDELEPPRQRPGAARHARDHASPTEFDADDVFVDLEPILGHRLYLKCEGFNFAGSIKLKAAAAHGRGRRGGGTAAARFGARRVVLRQPRRRARDDRGQPRLPLRCASPTTAATSRPGG